MNWVRICGVFLVWLGLALSGAVQANLDGLQAPQSTQGAWLIEALQETDNQDYFRALQSSQSMLYRTLGWGWPTGRLTAEANLDTMRFYVEQRDRRRSYSYVLRDAESGDLHGALFIGPAQVRPGLEGFNPRSYDVEVTFWLNQNGQDLPISTDLVTEVTRWLHEAWAVEQVLFPITQTNHFARQQLEQADLVFVANNANNNELLYRFDAR